MFTDRRTVLAGGLALIATRLPAEAPAVPRLRRISPALDRMVDPGTQPEVIATGIRWAEGPLWVDAGQYLLFSDPPANIVRRWQRGRGASVFLDPSGAAGTDPARIREPGANGLALDAGGRLLIANSGGRSIDRLVDLTTRKRIVLADRYAGKRFNSPNDMHVARDGSIYFTDPPYGLSEGDASPLKEQPVNGVYRRRPDGRIDLLDGSLTRPNGIALSPDERLMYVAVSDDAAPRIMVYDLDGRGMPVAARIWLDARSMAKGGPGLPDGMKVARDGTLLCSVPGGVMFMTPEAEPIGLVEHGAPIANCAFGEGGRALFLTANDRVLRLTLKPGWQGR